MKRLDIDPHPRVVVDFEAALSLAYEATERVFIDVLERPDRDGLEALLFADQLKRAVRRGG
jgi:hypothetical protein